jgi:hypothetical protein
MPDFHFKGATPTDDRMDWQTRKESAIVLGNDELGALSAVKVLDCGQLARGFKVRISHACRRRTIRPSPDLVWR